MKAKRRPRPTRRTRRIQPYVGPTLHARLVEHCAARGVTESSVVTESLTQYLDGLSDPTLLYRRLDRVTRALDRTERELGVLSQAFALFVRLWLAHTQRLPKESRAAATASAEERYREFLDALALRVAGGKRLFDDLPQDQLADHDELASLAEQASGPGAPPPPATSPAGRSGRRPLP